MFHYLFFFISFFISFIIFRIFRWAYFNNKCEINKFNYHYAKTPLFHFNINDSLVFNLTLWLGKLTEYCDEKLTAAAFIQNDLSIVFKNVDLINISSMILAQ